MLVVVLVGSSPAGASSVYGRGSYGSQLFPTITPTPTPTPTPTSPPTSSPSPTAAPSASPSPVATTSPAPPTIITGPTGILFAINLSAGQVITAPEYVVTVTPINGQGKTIAKVEFLVDGQLASTATPDTTGTFTWRWAVTAGTAPVVTVILYAADGDNVSRQIPVHIVAPTSASPSPKPSPPSNPITALVTALTDSPAGQAAAKIVHQIPVPLAYAFPYLLFALLGAGLLLLVWQLRREVVEAEELERTLAQEQQLGQEKATLAQLAPHYLRTPLTVISGGIEVLEVQHGITPEQSADIKRRIAQLHDRIERLLGEIVTPIAGISATPPPHARLRVWLKPGFWGPLVLIGGLALGFNLLAQSVGRISLTTLNLLLQAAAFSLLVMGSYILLRTRILRHRQRERTRHLLATQADIDHQRNDLIAKGTQELATELAALKPQLERLAAGKGRDLAFDGYHRFKNVVDKFALAAHLEAARRGQAPAQTLSLQALLTSPVAAVADAAQAKHLRLNLPTDASLIVHQPELLKTVISSLLDNAVAYTPAGGTVDVVLQSGLDQATLTVTDSGPGIPQEKLDLLFQPFSRPDGALTFTHEGMGFSLYLDKLIMQYLGGNISAGSISGRGLSVAIKFSA